MNDTLEDLWLYEVGQGGFTELYLYEQPTDGEIMKLYGQVEDFAERILGSR